MKKQKEYKQKLVKSEQTDHSIVNHHQEEQLTSKKTEEDGELFIGEKKFRTGLGWLTIFFIILLFFTETTMSQEEGIEVIQNRVSHAVESGFTIETDTEIQIDARDFEITGFDGQGEARMLIWDYRGDTGNEIQILADGQVIREVHRLNSNVAAYSVPVPGVITIRGLESHAAQPITYAVKFPERKETIFNLVPVNGTNQYTLIPRF
ncbi:hypothetical protein BTR23_13400 [Alkalihalophilus pseudofirmus]|nr:hypothetical protein BTR23_13400 [Alkalihalophilus pseudofirmus]